MRHHSYALTRTHAADMAALRRLIDGADTCECSDCLGEGGFRIYPSEHSFRTTWIDCETCNGEGRVPAGEDF